MSINMSAAIPEDKKHTRWGDHYWNIDFEMDGETTISQVQQSALDRKYSPSLGTLEFNGSTVDLTEKEAMKVIDTLRHALNARSHAFNMGILLP